jgi:DNA polymerase III sliding clamp (beta) subunit (PCNA family)
MTEKTSTNREALVKIAALVRPALATQAYIPALTHIKFDGNFASAYNDISAIMVRASVDVSCCLPGELLIRSLNSFSAESIAFQESTKDKAVVLSSGRSKLKLPVLGNEAFPFELPDTKKAHEIVLDASIMKGIDRCLLSVGNDPTHPAQMGVTLDADDKGNAILYSTDNFTISRYATKTKIDLPGDSPVILPTFFCSQLVALSKAFPEDEVVLLLLPGALLVEFGKNARLFNKTLVDLEPLDFPRIFDKHCKLTGLKERLFKIPDTWDAAFGRAMLVLSGEVDKATKVTVSEDNIKIHSTSPMGDSDDSMSHEGENLDAPAEPFYIDPALVIRASKACGLMAFNEKALSLADAEAQFTHLIAYCSK